MDEERQRRLIDEAFRIGEQHGNRAIKLSFEIGILRRAMWRALHQLRQGRHDAARNTLEQTLKRPSC